MKPLTATQMTEIEALILINQGLIMSALGTLTSKEMRDELIKATEITLKEVDKYAT